MKEWNWSFPVPWPGWGSVMWRSCHVMNSVTLEYAGVKLWSPYGRSLVEFVPQQQNQLQTVYIFLETIFSVHMSSQLKFDICPIRLLWLCVRNIKVSFSDLCIYMFKLENNIISKLWDGFSLVKWRNLDIYCIYVCSRILKWRQLIFDSYIHLKLIVHNVLH